MMDSASQPYRLEVAVKRVYGLSPLIAGTASKIAVEVHFLDFPSIVVHPQGFAVGDSVTYNVCHKADFRMTAEQTAAVFPAVCQCHLSNESKSNVLTSARWSCPCTLLLTQNGGTSTMQRTYANCVIRSAAGEPVGYAEMSCVVIPLAPPSAPSPPPAAPALQQQMLVASSASPHVASTTATTSASPLPPPQQQLSASSPATQKTSQESEQGKPYIVRVVVGESDRKRRGGCHDRQGKDDDDESIQEGVALTHNGAGSHCGSPLHRVPINIANEESLLYVLQYDVAYQLQSLSETIAAALQREHPVLSGTSLAGESKDGGLSISKLTKTIDHTVAQMVRLANIVLQVANQLIDGSPAPARAGTSREVKDMARQKRNPVNKLPTPADGSVGHYLQYDVLYQLQCLGTNLTYVTLAYRDVLDTPLSAIPKQHADFCLDLGDGVQRLTKLLNILIQSSVDGAFGPASAANTAAAKVHGDKKKKTSKSRHHRNTSSAKTKPSARALSISEVKSSRSSSSSSYSSFTQSSSTSSSSSLTSSDSSLNRPMTPVSAPLRPAVEPVAGAPPNPAMPNLSSQPLQQVTQPAATTPPVVPPPAVASQPPIDPPPYTMVAAPPSTSAAAATTPATDTPPQESSNSSLSVQGPTPFSWVNAMNQNQQNASLSMPPPLSTSVTSRTSAVFAPAPVTVTTQPVVPAVAPPTHNAPQLPVGPPKLSLPSPLTPPTVLSSPARTAVAPPPPPAIPIPVPIPR
jgi:lambda repressor-like predicted transcriptional regulator